MQRPRQQHQSTLNLIKNWLKFWRINESQRRVGTLPRALQLAYLELGWNSDSASQWRQVSRYVPRQQLNWRKHISDKRKYLGLELSKMYWLLSRNLQLENKILLHKTYLVSNCGVQMQIRYCKDTNQKSLG